VDSHSDKWLGMYFCCVSWVMAHFLPAKLPAIEKQCSRQVIRYLHKLYDERAKPLGLFSKRHCSDFMKCGIEVYTEDHFTNFVLFLVVPGLTKLFETCRTGGCSVTGSNIIILHAFLVFLSCNSCLAHSIRFVDFVTTVSADT
jgi:hypothetical protein